MGPPATQLEIIMVFSNTHTNKLKMHICHILVGVCSLGEKKKSFNLPLKHFHICRAVWQLSRSVLPCLCALSLCSPLGCVSTGTPGPAPLPAPSTTGVFVSGVRGKTSFPSTGQNTEFEMKGDLAIEWFGLVGVEGHLGPILCHGQG